jgi:XTP/dITP diphosphohydrolase
MKTLYFITSNMGKVHEATEKLKPYGYKIIQKNCGYPEIQTETLEEVARFGITYLQNTSIDHSFILEDAGVFIDALHGFPGVYSSYVYHTISLNGILTLLEHVPEEKRCAQFKSVFAYGTPQGDMHVFIGTCKGKITLQQKGSKGFGYDPIFQPDGFTKTFAEMSTEQKNMVSHRAKSLEKLVEFLKTK